MDPAIAAGEEAQVDASEALGDVESAGAGEDVKLAIFMPRYMGS